MPFNGKKQETWDRTTANDGLIFDREFTQLYENDTVLNTAIKKSLKNDEYLMSQLIPIGSIVAWPTETYPKGWLECNGAIVSKNTHNRLFQVIGTTYGSGPTTNDFRLPDYRGYFLRGWDHGAGVDPDKTSRATRGDGKAGNIVGSLQLDEFKEHSHKESMAGRHGGHITQICIAWMASNSALYTHPNGGNETRPKNINTMYIIKY